MKKQDLIDVGHIISALPSTPKNDVERRLLFYRAAVELERYKSARSETTYPYALYVDKTETLLIDIPCNRDFHREFDSNVKAGTFHGSFAISLIVSANGADFRLLELCRPFDSVKSIDINRQLFACKSSDFNVNLREAERLTLSGAVIAEIEKEIANSSSFAEVSDIIKKHLGAEATISGTIYLSLRTEDNVLSSTIAELKKISGQQLQDNELLSLFLRPNKFENKILEIDPSTLLAVSPIDESQRNAIATALGQKLTVVTGPPGTGKTQLIVNLIANGLVRGMSMLVASKNNRAVDNVKERLDVIDKRGYTIRYGNREILGKNTIPELEKFRDLAESKGVELSSEYAAILKDYRKACHDVEVCNAKLAKMESLGKALSDARARCQLTENQLREAETTFSREKLKFAEKWAQFRGLKLADKDNFDHCRRDLLRLRNKISAKYSGILSFLHNCFSKHKDANHFIEFVEGLPSQIREAVIPETWTGVVEDYHAGTDIVNQCDVLLANFKKADEYFHGLLKIEGNYGRECSLLRKEAHDLTLRSKTIEIELTSLRAEETAVRKLLASSQSLIKACGCNIVEAVVSERLSKAGAKVAIAQYKQHLPNVPWKKEEISRFIQHTADMLQVLQVNATTSLSVKTAFPLQNQLFDMLIVDEASQCDLASALPMILRAKRVVIIGDPLQLKHISGVRTFEEEEIAKHLGITLASAGPYGRQSLWDHAAEVLSFASSGNAISNLVNHYRCHPDIIGFSNQAFYIPRAGINLSVLTGQSHPELKKQGIILHPVIGIQKMEDENSNEAEALECIKIAVDLHGKYPEMTIGIVTPFRHQANLINTLMPQNLKDNIIADTVNRYQGDERDIMIYSLMVTDNSPKRKLNWIDNKNEPNLINVAITRARNLLYIVGNIEYVKRNSPMGHPLGDLIRYASQKQKV